MGCYGTALYLGILIQMVGFALFCCGYTKRSWWNRGWMGETCVDIKMPSCLWIPIVGIRWSFDRNIFTIEIPILVRFFRVRSWNNGMCCMSFYILMASLYWIRTQVIYLPTFFRVTSLALAGVSSYPGYSRKPHWFSMGLPEISRITFDRYALRQP